MSKAIECARALVAKWDTNPHVAWNAATEFCEFVRAIVIDAKEAAPPTIDEFVGPIPGVTGGKDSVAHVREMRGHDDVPAECVAAAVELCREIDAAARRYGFKDGFQFGTMNAEQIILSHLRPVYAERDTLRDALAGTGKDLAASRRNERIAVGHLINRTSERDAARAELAALHDALSDYNSLTRRNEELSGELEALRRRGMEYEHAIEQTLGKALGYPKYADDQKNFPGETSDDVCVGEHVALTLAGSAATALAALHGAPSPKAAELATVMRAWITGSFGSVDHRIQKLMQFADAVARLQEPPVSEEAESVASGFEKWFVNGGRNEFDELVSRIRRLTRPTLPVPPGTTAQRLSKTLRQARLFYSDGYPEIQELEWLAGQYAEQAKESKP